MIWVILGIAVERMMTIEWLLDCFTGSDLKRLKQRDYQAKRSLYDGFQGFGPFCCNSTITWTSLWRLDEATGVCFE